MTKQEFEKGMQSLNFVFQAALEAALPFKTHEKVREEATEVAKLLEKSYADANTPASDNIIPVDPTE